VLRAIQRLCDAGFDPRNLSVVTRQSKASQHSLAASPPGSGLRPEIECGTVWDRIELLLCGWACFPMPKLGVVLAAGPLAGWINAALRNETLLPGLSSMGAGLCSIGIPRSLVPFYEAEVRAGGFLLIAHGSTKDVVRARGILNDLQKPNDRASTASEW